MSPMVFQNNLLFLFLPSLAFSGGKRGRIRKSRSRPTGRWLRNDNVGLGSEYIHLYRGSNTQGLSLSTPQATVVQSRQQAVHKTARPKSVQYTGMDGPSFIHSPGMTHDRMSHHCHTYSHVLLRLLGPYLSCHPLPNTLLTSAILR